MMKKFVTALALLGVILSLQVSFVAAQGSEPTTYEVQEGDKLESIAEDFGISVEDLLAANPELAADEELEIDDELEVGIVAGETTLGGYAVDRCIPAGEQSSGERIVGVKRDTVMAQAGKQFAFDVTRQRVVHALVDAGLHPALAPA